VSDARESVGPPPDIALPPPIYPSVAIGNEHHVDISLNQPS